MVIRQMQLAECQRMLASARLFRLACAFENQPYVVPVYAVYHENPDGQACLYGVTTYGQKIDWMRANPLVSVETDQFVSWSQWCRVVVLGNYIELDDMPEQNFGRAPALHQCDVQTKDLTLTPEPISNYWYPINF